MSALLNQAVVSASGDTTGTTDTAALQAAIDAVANQGGGEVRYGVGLWINDTITGRTGVHLIGIGGSQANPNVRLAPGSNCLMLALDEAGCTSFVMIGGVWDGDRFNQTGTSGGFYFGAGAPYGGIFSSCAYNEIHDTIVQFAAGIGVELAAGQVEDRVDNLKVFSSGGGGFKAGGSDLFFKSITVGETGEWGFDIAGSDIRISDSKAWYAGRTRTTRNATSVTDGGGTFGGWIVNVQGLQGTNLGAQDCTGPAMFLSGAGGHVQIHSDGNGIGGGSQAAGLGVGYCTGMDITLTMSNTSGHYQTPYPVLFGPQTSLNRLRGIASAAACAHPTEQAPGSTPDVSDHISLGAADI